MTAQILLDALDQKEVEGICQFSLIIFDECHHTHQRHPFNSIMHHYMDAKYKDDDQPFTLPQVSTFPPAFLLHAASFVGHFSLEGKVCSQSQGIRQCWYFFKVYFRMECRQFSYFLKVYFLGNVGSLRTS